MGLLEGDAIVLAGATGRVGGATLATLVREGARVVVISRSLDRAVAAIGRYAPAAGDRAFPYEVDLADPASAEAAIAVCVERFGRIDALASLAGSSPRIGPLIDSTVDDLRTNLAAYVETAYNLALPALRAMLPCRSVPVRSHAAVLSPSLPLVSRSAPGRGLFGVAKAAVNILMRAIAREHKADGIVANALVLGGAQIEEARSHRTPEEFAAAATPKRLPIRSPSYAAPAEAGSTVNWWM